MSRCTRGVLYVHSSPPALCRHIEWAAASALGQELVFHWIEQPAEPGSLRTDVSWTGEPGTGARLSSALRGWEHLRFEVTEEPIGVQQGLRYMHTPSLGLFTAHTDEEGIMVIREGQVRQALDHGSVGEIREAFDLVLGQAWDDELEPFRYAGAGMPVRWFNRISGVN